MPTRSNKRPSLLSLFEPPTPPVACPTRARLDGVFVDPAKNRKALRNRLEFDYDDYLRRRREADVRRRGASEAKP